MKVKFYTKIVNYFIIFSLFLTNIVGASMPDTFKIITDKQPLYTVQYDGYNITARKLRIEGSNNVTYCLEINRNYPTGQNFSISDEINEKLNNILAAGYPNRSVTELNLDNENEAYFATQIAIWSLISGYDVTMMKGDNPKIIAAINNIYNDGINAKYNNVIQSKIYKTSDPSIQEVVVISVDDLISEEKAETKQAEYPPQEG
ncbi:MULTISPECIES: thioester domain-containing protein [unclassified Clostridium]|uniref:thioester domain-containing protein n=1 Tax=unclassified Clostridium TaxID=2614128 RepID=UPI00029863DD|nr:MULTISPECIES: thioester domain-containing protein [unclassified Clostridium]EKQ58234.1 MAG: TQXA domain containing protein [Clostridium sp. Maddingley MBC34-26]